MKEIHILLIGMLVVLVALAVPTAYGYVGIERLVPSETMATETGAGEAPWIVMNPDLSRLVLLVPAETAEVERGAGVTPVTAGPASFDHDTGRIEFLPPAK